MGWELLLWLKQGAIFLLPAMAANLSLYLFGRGIGEGLGPPVDLGVQWRGKRLVGDGRTLIGLPLVLMVGGCLGALLGDFWGGLILALGVDVGTVVHSFIKRRMNYPRGAPHRPWDHLDYVLGALLAYSCYAPLEPLLALSALVVGASIHAVASALLRPHLDKS